MAEIHLLTVLGDEKSMIKEGVDRRDFHILIHGEVILAYT